MVTVVDEQRFPDPRVSLYALAAEDILVVCPRCGQRALSRAVPQDNPWVAGWPRTLVCPGCGYSASWPAEGSAGSVWGGPADPFFRLPLWLTTTCCGGRTLWAFHRSHLDILHGYVSARLRERGSYPGGQTLVTRLPRWIKSAGNRDEVLRAIDKLRASLPVS